MSEEQLQDDFAERLSSVSTRLYSYIYSLICNINDADDLYQQTTIVLWSKFEQFDTSREFSSWAFGIARFEVSNFLKKRTRQRLYFSDELSLQLMTTLQHRHESGVDRSGEDQERRDALSACIQKLRKPDRELMADCYDDRADLKEVAHRAGRSVTSIYNSLRRIRKSLFQCVRASLNLSTDY